MTGPVMIARCPVHGLHGVRANCFECGEPAEQAMVTSYGEAVALRRHAGSLRQIATELDERAELLDPRGVRRGGLLRGRAIGDAAAAVLHQDGPHHYTELVDRVEALTGKTVAGEDRGATLLTAIGRHERIQTVASPFGVYRYRPIAEGAIPAAVSGSAPVGGVGADPAGPRGEGSA